MKKIFKIFKQHLAQDFNKCWIPKLIQGTLAKCLTPCPYPYTSCMN